ncbi:MAG: ABC transporter permease subunit, partial [Candidatus Lokiarchaeota archaeon]
FQILVDDTPYIEINASDYFYDSGNMYEYSGSTIITFEGTGTHNITLISIDGAGNNYTSSLAVEIIDYPIFSWGYFGIGIGVFAGIALLVIFLLRYQTNRGYRDSLGIIYKKELAANKVKAIIFMIIGVAPGIILSLFFGAINFLLHGISIDQVRSLISTIMNFYLIYFELIFTIVFASSSIINHKRDGSLSWFMSKPVRRWEFLWGKTLAYMTIGVLVMIPTSISIVVSGLLYLEPIYILDMLSIGGFIFIIGIATIIPLVAIGMLLSTIFKKSGLAIFIPIMMLVILPTIVGFLPILVRHEWPLLFSYSYYSEKLGMFWISQSGQGLSNIIGPYSQLLGITITTFGFTASDILLILSLITIVSMIIATLYIRRIDI